MPLKWNAKQHGHRKRQFRTDRNIRALVISGNPLLHVADRKNSVTGQNGVTNSARQLRFETKRLTQNIQYLLTDVFTKLFYWMRRYPVPQNQVKSSQKCFIAIQEKVYIDQNNKTEAHSGLFVPLIWEYHCIILTSFWFNRLVGCKGPADTWHDEVITTFKLHDIFLIQ